MELHEDGLIRPTWALANPLMQHYYDTEWGMPTSGDDAMFERLSLEAFQAGLSWQTILNKRDAFREVFHGFNIDAVANMSDADCELLLADARIIRNRLKIFATRNNARAAVKLRTDGGLEAFIWSFKPECTLMPTTEEEFPSQSPESVALAKALKKRGFAFVGPTTSYALMSAVGIVDLHLMSSHRRGSSGVWPK